MPGTLSAEETKKRTEYWFAANHPTVGQIYMIYIIGPGHGGPGGELGYSLLQSKR